jgi:hypothetical protein
MKYWQSGNSCKLYRRENQHARDTEERRSDLSIKNTNHLLGPIVSGNDIGEPMIA